MPHRRKYSDEFKLKVVEEYQSGLLGGTNALAKKYGVHNSEVEKWVNQYKEHGPAGLASKAGIYDGDFKLYVVEYMHTHSLSAKATAIRFGIVSHSTVLHWERIYYEEGPEALFKERRGRKKMNDKKPAKPKKKVDENEDLLQEVQRLRMENEYLKKLNALVQEREKSEQKKESK